MMAIAGIIFIAIGAVLWWVQRRQQGRCTQLKLARPSQAADLTATADAVATEIGGGHWRDYVWLRGSIQAASPLTSELKQLPCVSYTSTVVREYEETVREKDSDGHMTTRTQRGSETISEHRQQIPFDLVDRSGAIRVDPEGAQIERVEVLNEFRPGTPAGNMLSFGPFSLVLSSDSGHGNRKTLGYRYQETVLPLDRPVLVVGMVCDRHSSLTITKPDQANQPFIITLKTHEALTQAVNQSAQVALWTMVGCFGVGAVLVLAAIVG
ncbi:E3 ubiquitin ligase family protein [Nodosilinea sp. LEGE 07088]|uniref:E3 ubiquitin ligase family protein n=1 Tax=Nodosilinea sp. LEGE 07088 TaxID=2777968 RepID=UPI00187FCE95|nr:E3 ubiquitin ligase family protein [Nodosilinea sp. LEGE 07088]MBE9141000.1 E3 ubiquitin ligase family protein [Nodosilinea sp. LEGE 07088]